MYRVLSLDLGCFVTVSSSKSSLPEIYSIILHNYKGQWPLHYHRSEGEYPDIADQRLRLLHPSNGF